MWRITKPKINALEIECIIKENESRQRNNRSSSGEGTRNINENRQNLSNVGATLTADIIKCVQWSSNDGICDPQNLIYDNL